MNTSQLNQQLKDVLWADEVLALLIDVGWNDGGCRSLMKAFLIWFDSEMVMPYQIVKSPEERHSEHVVVRIGQVFLDGDGISTESELIDRWKYEERLGNVFLREFDPLNEPAHRNGEKPYYVSDSSIQQIVEYLDKYLSKKKIFECLLDLNPDELLC